jgi:hypothetical protein
MSMTIADTHIDAPHRSNAGHFPFIVLSTALVTLVLVPGLAIAISYLAGGAATATVLFVYLFAGWSNGPFLCAAVALTVGAAAWLAVSHWTHHSLT